ncbi:MAG: hypothetical protein IH945_04395 [Armatimonadetes bacterium]|nr:hypothetical protein [Armatimonadota bacterium]
MADREDIKFQVVYGGGYTHYDFRKSTGGFKGDVDGDHHRTVTEIDEKFEARLNKKLGGDRGTVLREAAIAFFDKVGDELNEVLSNVVFYGARLQIRKYDE